MFSYLLDYFLALKYVFLKCVFRAVWPYCSFRMRQATYDKEDTIWASAKYGKLSIDRLPNLSISFSGALDNWYLIMTIRMNDLNSVNCKEGET